tara:strand:+ start:77 stop:1144 length:1068 start_codon:yes stop_codon:yes gene_type:complete
MSQTINYSLCWEDQDILKVLHQEGHDILIIGSGGCLSLSSLAIQDVRMHIIDINELQIKLIKLKVCAFNNLSYDDCMYFFGTFTPPKKSVKRIDILLHLLEYLPKNDQSFWKLNRNSITKGLIHIGKWERYIRIWNKYFLPLVVGHKTITDFINSNKIEDQISIYNNKIDNFYYQLIFKTFTSKIIQSRFGRHPDLLKHFKDSPGDIWHDRLKKAWCKIPIFKNYFFRYILESHYRESMALPNWAIRENYDIISKRTSNVSFYTNSLTEYLLNTDKNFDMIYISNITDTLDQRESDILFNQCAASLKKEGKLIIWNNLVERKPLKNFLLMNQLSNTISKSRIASYYGYFGVYQLK